MTGAELSVRCERRRAGRAQDGARRLRRPRRAGGPHADEASEFVASDLADGVPVIVEERVAMKRELAALVARSPFGQGAAWPVVETVQRDGICVVVLAPAPGLRRESPARQGSWRCGWRPSWASSACWRSSCSRPSTARWSSTSWRCARTTPATGPWTVPAPRSSSSTCARCSTTRSATPVRSRRSR